jgi:hypothetical protein
MIKKLDVWVVKYRDCGDWFDISVQKKRPEISCFYKGFVAPSFPARICEEQGRKLFPGLQFGQVRRYTISATPKKEKRP